MLNGLAAKVSEAARDALFVLAEKRFTTGRCPDKLRALIDFGIYGSEGEDDRTI
jgi:hypothetical protein